MKFAKYILSLAVILSFSGPVQAEKRIIITNQPVKIVKQAVLKPVLVRRVVKVQPKVVKVVKLRPVVRHYVKTNDGQVLSFLAGALLGNIIARR